MKKTLIIDKETKQHISLILKYYRQQNKIKQHDFIQHNQHFICSSDTYSRIENGKIIKRNTIYFEFLQKLGFQYLYSCDDWKSYDVEFKCLLKYLHMYQIEELCQKCNSLLLILQNSKDYLAYEICVLLEDLREFYQNDQQLSDEQYQKYCFLFSIFPNHLQIIIKYMLFIFVSKTKRDFITCQKLYQQLQFTTSKDALLQLVEANAYIYEKRYLESYAIALHLKQQFYKEHNIHRLVEIYEILLYLYRIVQQNRESSGIVKEFMDFYDHEYLHMCEATRVYAQFLKAQIHFHRNEYSQAYPLFLSLYQSQIDCFQLYAAVFLFHINPNVTCKFKANVPLSYPLQNNPIACLYHYFTYKENRLHSAQELELYMCKHVLPTIQHADPIFYTIVYTEISQLIRVTKHYYIKKKL